MKKITLLAVISFCMLFTKLHAQVGIGTATPNATALLHVDAGTSTTKGLLMTGTADASATVPDLGTGSRLMFYPGKGAFRAGSVDGTQWDDANVGFYSVALGGNSTSSGHGSTAMGLATKASGYASTAMGEYTTASGRSSTSMGNFTTSSGVYSTAMGTYTVASGKSSTSMGHFTTASGLYSTAMGFGTTASGESSTAMGNFTTASGIESTSMGNNTTASGANSTAMGNYTAATGINSTSMGNFTGASGDYSTAMGYSTTASGGSSTAMGNSTTASAPYSTAMGYSTTASGASSTAMGYGVSTNGQTGAFIIGDSDPLSEGTTYSGFTNEFVARFNNGYYFMTSGDANRYGVSIGHNGNSWVSICDKNRKENFEPLNGEDVLQKLSHINFTSWNYKKQDPKAYRHYGIMAQDFNTAFGKDKYGTIGNDTTVNPIDMIGIDMAAIQALVKRTTELKNDNEKLKDKDEAINKKLAEVTELKKENESLRQSMAQLQASFNEQQKLVAQSLQQMKALAILQNAKETVTIK